jgi:hypothetical protein
MDDAQTEASEEPTDPDPIEVAAELLADEGQARLWLKALLPILQLRSHDTDPIGRVQFSYDQMHIAACERATRILRSDLPAT